MEWVNLRKIRLEDIIVTLKYLLALIIGKNFKFLLKEKIWLISERGDEARDNGYHLYKYIKKNHPEIECYYLIKKKSKDYEKIKKYGNIIEYGSLKHYFYYICSKVCISTHIYRYIPNQKVVQRLDSFFKLKKIRVFLQHGIIKDSHPYLNSKNNPLDLFCCGAKRECEFIKDSLKYSDKIAIYTGLARYDSLYEFEIKNQILLMPTWRGDLYQLSNKEFMQSDYFQAFQFILSSEELAKKLKEKKMKLIFYPHYEMQKYIFLFNTKFNNIIIAEHEKYDVQELLKESKILITDYSSVFFDFSYMKKPIIYYQFDKDIYFKRHYEKGYFDYEFDGFGEVVGMNDVIEKIIKYIDKPVMPNFYKDRVDNFFNIRDKKNCERIFNIIKEKVEKNG